MFIRAVDESRFLQAMMTSTPGSAISRRSPEISHGGRAEEHRIQHRQRRPEGRRRPAPPSSRRPIQWPDRQQVSRFSAPATVAKVTRNRPRLGSPAVAPGASPIGDQHRPQPDRRAHQGHEGGLGGRVRCPGRKSPTRPPARDSAGTRAIPRARSPGTRRMAEISCKHATRVRASPNKARTDTSHLAHGDARHQPSPPGSSPRSRRVRR